MDKGVNEETPVSEPSLKKKQVTKPVKEIQSKLAFKSLYRRLCSFDLCTGAQPYPVCAARHVLPGAHLTTVFPQTLMCVVGNRCSMNAFEWSQDHC